MGSTMSARPRLAWLNLATIVGAATLSLAACSGSPQPTFTAQASSTTAQPTQSSVATLPPVASAPAVNCTGLKGVSVSSASALSAALAAARPGTTILLTPGAYPGKFSATTSGTAAQPITLCGPRAAVLDGGGVKNGYTLHLERASWWRVEGFTVEGGQKGVMLDTSDHDLIAGLYVHNVGDEGIHLREFSSYDTVSRNVIRSTGLDTSKYGEGVYVGTANKNWCRYTGCKPDGSDYDIITGNNIADTTAEDIDIKEGTSGGIVTGNSFNGTGMDLAAATSWVNVKGNDWKITGNVGADSVDNGLSDHQVYAGWGMGNEFANNKVVVNGPGYGIYVQSKRLKVIVSCSNKVSGASKGYSNMACTPA